VGLALGGHLMTDVTSEISDTLAGTRRHVGQPRREENVRT
jgi:hypothetical protein